MGQGGVEGDGMKYGPIVAEKFKKQYFKKGKWEIMPGFWPIQPEQLHKVVKELSSKESIEIVLNKSWTRRLPKPKKVT